MNPTYLLCASISSGDGPFWTWRWAAGPTEENKRMMLGKQLMLTFSVNPSEWGRKTDEVPSPTCETGPNSP